MRLILTDWCNSNRPQSSCMAPRLEFSRGIIENKITIADDERFIHHTGDAYRVHRLAEQQIKYLFQVEIRLRVH